MSDLVNEAVQLSLAEDAEDLATLEDRVNEPAFAPALPPGGTAWQE